MPPPTTFQALSHGACPHLVHLDLSYLRLEAPHARVLGTALATALPALHRLVLAGNPHLKDDGVVAIVDGLANKPGNEQLTTTATTAAMATTPTTPPPPATATTTSGSCSGGSSIRSLDLFGVGMGRGGACVLAKALVHQSLPHLEELVLDHNAGIGDRGMAAIVAGLARGCRGLRVLSADSAGARERAREVLRQVRMTHRDGEGWGYIHGWGLIMHAVWPLSDTHLTSLLPLLMWFYDPTNRRSSWVPGLASRGLVSPRGCPRRSWDYGCNHNSTNTGISTSSSSGN